MRREKLNIKDSPHKLGELVLDGHSFIIGYIAKIYTLANEFVYEVEWCDGEFCDEPYNEININSYKSDLSDFLYEVERGHV